MMIAFCFASLTLPAAGCELAEFVAGAPAGPRALCLTTYVGLVIEHARRRRNRRDGGSTGRRLVANDPFLLEVRFCGDDLLGTGDAKAPSRGDQGMRAVPRVLNVSSRVNAQPRRTCLDKPNSGA